MKRSGNLYPFIYDFANIDLAYLKARKCKRYRTEVLRFTQHREENIINIQNHLIWKSYEPKPYKKFKVYEPKERQIMALPFTDRVVQHAINNILEPIFERGFIYHSYACRDGKGMHAASQTLSQWLYNLSSQNGTKQIYCLKADVSKYFNSIDHDVLKRIIRKRIKCKDTLWLIDLIIDHNGEQGSRTGIPVGNLTSQLFANAYLNELDQFVKHKLKIKYYMRYMDDFLIISEDRHYLKWVWEVIKNFIETELRLTLNPKTAIFPAKNGIDFVGYRHWSTHKKLRKSSIKRIRKKIKKYNGGAVTEERFKKSMQSWLGHISHADTYKLKHKILESVKGG